MKIKHEIGDGPVEEQYREKMIETVKALDRMFNGDARGNARKVGFILMVFPYNDGGSGRCNYMSNGANREDVKVLLKEQLARFEGQPEMKGTT